MFFTRPLLLLLLPLISHILASDTFEAVQPQPIATTFEITGNLKLKHCKHGTFLLNSLDTYVSKHLDYYGEWGEKELQLFLKLIKEGDVVIDAGANIGAFTVPLAKAVGYNGEVHAFEPQRVVHQRLNANIALNGLTNVYTYNKGLSDTIDTIPVYQIDYSVEDNNGATSIAGVTINHSIASVDLAFTDTVFVTTLDSIEFHRCPSFMKFDVELMELKALNGAENLIMRCKPIIYVENNCKKTSPKLIEKIFSVGYVPFWVVEREHNAMAFNGELPDITGGSYEINMICIPTELLQRNGGYISTQDLQEIQPNRPYLHQYFIYRSEIDGHLYYLYEQGGNSTNCFEKEVVLPQESAQD